LAAEIARTAATEQTADDAYLSTLSRIDGRLAEIEKEVWNPRMPARKYVRLRARRQGLLEARGIVHTLLLRLRGQAETTLPPTPRARPRGTYGGGV